MSQEISVIPSMIDQSACDASIVSALRYTRYVAPDAYVTPPDISFSIHNRAYLPTSMRYVRNRWLKHLKMRHYIEVV